MNDISNSIHKTRNHAKQITIEIRVIRIINLEAFLVTLFWGRDGTI